jgi:HNH endonuclease
LGYCWCGCGQRTRVPARTVPRAGQVAGVPLRFVHGHNSRGASNSSWRGGRHAMESGYIRVWRPQHPHADVNGYVYEHVLVACQALGKALPPKAEVHHVNGRRADNAPQNLVICPDNAYHTLLHVRAEAYRACGHADWRRCKFCRRWDRPAQLYIHERNAYHRACRVAYRREHGC